MVRLQAVEAEITATATDRGLRTNCGLRIYCGLPTRCHYGLRTNCGLRTYCELRTTAICSHLVRAFATPLSDSVVSPQSAVSPQSVVRSSQ